MNLQTISLTVTPQNSVRLSSSHHEFFISERDMIIKFGVKIPKDIQGKQDPLAKSLLQTFIFDYNNSVVMKEHFQKKLAKKTK